MPNVQPQLSDEERTRCEIWTRVMGYFRPVSSFNIGERAHAGGHDMLALPLGIATLEHALVGCRLLEPSDRQ